MAIAIDFGTSNTLVTRWNAVKKQAEVLEVNGLSQKLLENPPIIPSQIYVENAATGAVVTGKMVGDRGLDSSPIAQRFYRNFKRGIGATTQGFLPELDGEQISFEKLGRWYLSNIFQQLQKQEGSIDSLVMTVPVDSFESYRSWLTQVCGDFPGIEKIQLLDEPTAAALGYGALSENFQTVLVVDFGGGTVDFSLVELDLAKGQTKPTGFIMRWASKSYGDNDAQKVKTAKVLAKAGKNLGGSDIDNWLFDYFVEQKNIPKNPLTLRLIERLKIQLSKRNRASEAYYDAETFETIDLALKYDEFQDILAKQGFFEQLDELMSQVLQQARRNGLNKSDIDGVLLVGGTSQIPAVKTWLQGYFPEEKIKSDNPFGAIAAGALQLSQGFELKDFLYHSYGIRYWNRRNKCHDWHPIIKQGQAYPMAEPIELTLGASIEQQPSIELILGELGEQTTGTEIYFDGDRLITKSLGDGQTNVKPLNDTDSARTIATLDPLGYPGSDRIQLQFLVDEDRCLRVTVEDLLSNVTLLNNQKVAEIS